MENLERFLPLPQMPYNGKRWRMRESRPPNFPQGEHFRIERRDTAASQKLAYISFEITHSIEQKVKILQEHLSRITFVPNSLVLKEWLKSILLLSCPLLLFLTCHVLYCEKGNFQIYFILNKVHIFFILCTITLLKQDITNKDIYRYRYQTGRSSSKTCYVRHNLQPRRKSSLMAY